MRIFIILLSLTYFSCTAQSKTQEPKLNNIALIAGTWHGEAFGGKTEEISDFCLSSTTSTIKYYF
ncbi:hypothetical protein [Winogradskyella ursingii]|uniref:hypothetical protein n=1 Tax=Winogradskyella ursingii TaxID=2686079 RepID=UPI0015CCCEC1|nr:hypothetical protein [Winogradskyella ursingii]